MNKGIKTNKNMDMLLRHESLDAIKELLILNILSSFLCPNFSMYLVVSF